MRISLVLALCLVSAACTSVRPIEDLPDELHQNIRAGKAIHSGDRVMIVTSDGQIRRFRVQAIDAEQNLVKGADGVIHINDIVAVEKREFSPGKTIGLIIGSVVIVEMVTIGNVLNAIMSGGF